jgi:hypothetical protein
MIVKGLGTLVCDDTGYCYDDGNGSVAQLPSNTCTCVNMTCIENGNSCASTSGGNYGGSGSPVGTSVNPTSIVASISSAFANIFKTVQPLPQGCTQVAGPYGVSTQCSPNASTLNLTSGLTSLTSGGMLPILLIGGVVLLVMSRK